LPNPSNDIRTKLAAIIGLAAAIAVLWWLGFAGRGGPSPLVVYCAHDAIYSESVLKQFEAETGIPVEIRFDSEATKSLGLVEMILHERDQPRCDVFWNNELLGTLDIMDQGLLEPYKGEGYARMPGGFKDPLGRWTGFAARLRVWIVNKEKHEATESAIAETMAGDDLSRVTMAKALYGTTRTHYTVLWHVMGGERLKQWHRGLREREMIEAQSNGKTRDLVASGVCEIGWTDTDDFFGAVDDGKPVAAAPVRLETGEVICIPNTVSIIRGCKHPEAARKLVDYLLSEKVERQLAASRSRQIPLGPTEIGTLPAEMRQVAAEVDHAYPLTELGAARGECLAWLKTEYLH